MIVSRENKTAVDLAEARNEAQTVVDWQFTNAQARVKLKHLYPQVTLK